MKIFSHLKPYWYMVLAVLVLLIIQANSDLSLPNLTSEIVDIGIMQGGVESGLPSTIREESLMTLELFMNADEKAKVEENYGAPNEKGVRKLDLTSGTSKSSLEKTMRVPILLVSRLGQAKAPQPTLASVIAGIQAGAIPESQIMQMRNEVEDKIKGMDDNTLNQVNIQFVRSEYKAQGKDMAAIQNAYMWRKGGMMILLTFVSVSAAIIVSLIASWTAASVAKTIRSDLYEKILSFSSEEMDKFSQASLITRSTNDVQQVQMGLTMSMRAIYAPILGIGGVVNVLTRALDMAWIVGLAVGIVLTIVIVLISLTMPRFKKLQILVDQVNLVAREILTGLPVIRAFTREDFEKERFNKANTNLKNTQLFVNRVMTFMMPLMMVVMNVITLLIVWVGGHQIANGNLQVGNMMAFITYTMQIVMGFMMLSMLSIVVPRANVSAMRIDEVLATQATIENVENPQELNETSKGLVEFKDVSFRFPQAQSDALSNISFSAEPQKITAIIGSTGSGKSTVVNLIPRLYDVTGGEIAIDGVDIRQLSLESLHETIGFVPQKGVLFSGTIQSNIAFGDEEMPASDIEFAAEIAQATEFIETGDDGYERAISQGGGNVSGGQKQRLSIARALAKKPKILIFDDSFSALDNKTDVAVRRALNQHFKDTTMIIVAQKISTILHADQIIVLDEGRVIDKGTHEELMSRCVTYQEIAKSQLSSIGEG